MEQRKQDELRAALEKERDSVEHQLSEQGAGSAGVEVTVDEGFADSAHATAERSQALSLIEQLQAHRRDVLDALTKIERGVYGKCERCGQSIPAERLEARPTARLCVTCKQAG